MPIYKTAWVRFEEASCDSAATFCIIFFKNLLQSEFGRANSKRGQRWENWIDGERIRACMRAEKRERYKRLTSYSDQFQKGASTTFVFRTRGANHLKLIPKVSKQYQRIIEPKNCLYEHNQQTHGPRIRTMWTDKCVKNVTNQHERHYGAREIEREIWIGTSSNSASDNETNRTLILSQRRCPEIKMDKKSSKNCRLLL